MKRKLSAILAAAMLASSFGMSAMAEESVQARFTDYDQVNQTITVIAGTDTQKELGYLDGVTTILEADGLKFKDLNGNGQLDVYEDWRQDVDARVKDFYDQMTLEERAGLFYHVNTCGSPMGVDFADSRYMFGTESVVPDESSSFTSRSMWYYINVLNITSHLDNTNGTPAQQIVYHNAMQALAEDSRLGIPVVISNDREYNAWGGMIDVAHRIRPRQGQDDVHAAKERQRAHHHPDCNRPECSSRSQAQAERDASARRKQLAQRVQYDFHPLERYVCPLQDAVRPFQGDCETDGTPGSSLP